MLLLTVMIICMWPVTTNYRSSVDMVTSSSVWVSMRARTGNLIIQGVRLHNGHIYVCDRGNDCIQIFDTNLTFRHIISARGQFDAPYDLDSDTEGNAYIIQRNNHQIQVIDTSGQFVRQFGQEEGEGKLKDPTAVHVIGQFVYVSDLGNDQITVYQISGQFVTSFGRHGEGKGELDCPHGITSDQTGFVYVADHGNNCVQVF